MDFGLATVIYGKDKTASDVFEMSGFTGSLRYMAPEVALKQPYNERADVYSYGILIWQMASDRMPYPDMKINEFLQAVAVKGVRPPIDPAWPPRFQQLLKGCWSQDYKQRPAFDTIVNELSLLLELTGGIKRIYSRHWSFFASPAPATATNISSNQLVDIHRNQCCTCC
jgi:serine/threonine protein kinase